MPSFYIFLYCRIFLRVVMTFVLTGRWLPSTGCRCSCTKIKEHKIAFKKKEKFGTRQKLIFYFVSAEITYTFKQPYKFYSFSMC